MPSPTIAHLLTELTQLRLLTPGQIDSLPRDAADSTSFLQQIIERGWLTRFQAKELLEGRGPSLVIGSYLLIDRVGQGGMGDVFKARNWKLDRIVAIKTIRPEKLGSLALIRRFQREIRAAAALNHPNIVHAIDADEVNGMHFFVMEYAEGIDLSKIVKTHGPLPIAAACECIRQAALGLQHAFEHGMVHRDIKPGNLLLTTQDKKVKILDMGLVRMDASSEHSQSGTMTGEGAFMGTPDYIAPEQALESHTVDIRADLYSLGCTFFYLLTGKPPFPGGTMMQKVQKHINDPAPLVENLRPEVPVTISVIVQRLLQKDPIDRFQTPAELAEAIAAVQYQPESLPSVAQMAFEVEQTQVDSPFDRLDESVPQPTSIPAALPVETRSRKPIWIGGSAVLATLIGVGIWLATRESKKPEEPRKEIVENKQPPIVVKKKEEEKEKSKTKDPISLLPAGPATDEWVAAVQALSAEDQAKAVFAKLAELNDGFDPQHKSNLHFVKDSQILGLSIDGQAISDISPVRALKSLSQFTCRPPLTYPPQHPAIVSVADISPLKGLPLTRLYLEGNRVEDLSPLADMQLSLLILNGTRVSDLTPLKRMASLGSLNLSHTPVVDLKPLAELKVGRLELANTKVHDLRPLAKLPLFSLNLRNTDVSELTGVESTTLEQLFISGCPIKGDLSQLQKFPKLKLLEMYGDPGAFDPTLPVRNFEPLKKLPDLRNVGLSLSARSSIWDELKALPKVETINGQPAADFWKVVNPDPEQEQWEKQIAVVPAANQKAAVAKRMDDLHPGIKGKIDFTVEGGAIVKASVEISGRPIDLRFLRPLTKLQHLTIHGYGGSLQPLAQLPLRHLEAMPFESCLFGLSEMPLETLQLNGNLLDDVRHLSAIKSLRDLNIVGSVARVAPLAKLSLRRLTMPHSSPGDLDLLKDMKTLEEIELAYDDFCHRDALRAMTWLKKINGKMPDDFWKEIAEQQAEFVRRELVRLNGATGFKATVDQGALVGLQFGAKLPINLTPLRGLTDLRSLNVFHTDSTNPIDLTPLRGLNLKKLHLTGVQLDDFSPLQGMNLDLLTIHSATVTDFSTLKGTSIQVLDLWNCPKFSDLSSVKGLPLKGLHVSTCGVADLSPLANMPLDELMLAALPVRDLTPLQTMKTLKTLHLGLPHVKDLRPIQDLPIGFLSLEKMSPVDLTPLLKMSFLKQIKLEFEPFRGDADVLRKMPKLETINGRKAIEFLKEADDTMAAFQKWCDDVAKKPAKEQAEAVALELKNRNPNFDGKFTFELTPDGKAVDVFRFETVHITDISPIRAWPRLRELGAEAPRGRAGALSNLWPLRGLSVGALYLSNNSVADLRPVREVQGLRRLHVANTKVSDLSPLTGLTGLKYLSLSGSLVEKLDPLKGLKLTHFSASETAITDLRPLEGMPLESVILYNTRITDLSPLKGARLGMLWMQGTWVSDLSPLQGMPLEYLEVQGCKNIDHETLRKLPLRSLRMTFVPWRDSELIRSIKSLVMVNDKDPKEFHTWANWEDAVRAAPLAQQVEMVKAKLTELNGKNAEIDKLTAAFGKDKILEVRCTNTVKDISPLRAIAGMRSLRIGNLNDPVPANGLSDLGPFRGLPLLKLTLYSTAVSDLTPLAGMPMMESLYLHTCSVSDLSPLKGVPLKSLTCTYTKLESFESLQVTTLESINFGHVKSLAGLERQPLKRIGGYATRINSLEPIANCPVEYLAFNVSSSIPDLTPVARMKNLKTFIWGDGAARDISPLRGLSLETVYLTPQIKDLSPLANMPIKKLSCAFNVWRDEEVIRSLTKLETINIDGVSPSKSIGPENPGQLLPIVDFWKKVDKERADFDSWVAKVRAQKTTQEQIDLFTKKLIELNPKFAGTVVFEADKDGMVVKLDFRSDHVTNIAPVRAFAGLHTLDVRANNGATSPLTDLWPLQGMHLKRLYIQATSVGDLRPLREHPLEQLTMHQTPVFIDRDALILRQIKTLKTINGKPAAEVLK